MLVLAGLVFIVTQAWTVTANVEKTIFLGPSPIALPDVHPNLEELHLHVLTPSRTTLPTQLAVQFPSEAAPRGLESWYLLQHLKEGRRYEVRICWPATQPTDFWLETYSLSEVFNTPELITSLAQYSEQSQELDVEKQGHRKAAVAPAATQSVLFLRIQAAASYYTTNRTLMEYPELVDADIILDPFLLNVLPQSLGPVAIYITAVAIGAWFLSAYIYRWLLSAATDPPSKPHTD